MYIKYKNNIHNISNYQSVVKGPGASIHLIRNSGDNIVLEFSKSILRDKILSKIWDELIHDYYDVDDDVTKFENEEKYNI